MKRFLAYIVATMTSPRQGFTMILFDAQGLTVSVLLLLAAAIAWLALSLGWALSDCEPWMMPWLSISPAAYYFWQTLLAVPVILAAWILVAGFVQLLSHRIGGGGSFDATARLLALSIAIPRLVLAISALAVTILAWLGAFDASRWLNGIEGRGLATAIIVLLMLAEAAWMGILTSFAVRAAHKLRFRRSLLVAIPTALVYYGFVLVFLR